MFVRYSNNAFNNGEPREETVVYAVFQISSRLSDSHGWLLVSGSGFNESVQSPSVSNVRVPYGLIFTGSIL